MATSAAVLECCARLHNFVIDEDWPNDDLDESEVSTMPNSPNGEWGYLPTVEELVHIPGTSIIREAMVEYVQMEGFRRPAYNTERRTRQELFEQGLM